MTCSILCQTVASMRMLVVSEIVSAESTSEQFHASKIDCELLLRPVLDVMATAPVFGSKSPRPAVAAGFTVSASTSASLK
jgi:hypothetical protein